MRNLARTSTAAAHDPGDKRQEGLRRANLYGISSHKRLPHVHLEAKDARVRKDLAAALLAAGRAYQHADDGQDLHREHERVDDELNDRKHREHEGLRPPMDRIQRLQDLHTTVPKDLRTQTTSTSAHKREWRVGYKNNPHGTSRGPLNGMFEPFDAVREACTHIQGQDDGCPQHKHAFGISVAVAYPLAHTSPARIEAEMQPFDEEAAREAMERKTSVQRNQDACETTTENPGGAIHTHDQHWCPASFSTISDKGKPKHSASGGANVAAAGTQLFPVRKVVTGEPSVPHARKAPLVIDDKCVQKKQSLLAKAAASYARIRKRIDCAKDPRLRYALPVEDASQQRAYRLGLDSVPSSSSFDSLAAAVAIAETAADSNSDGFELASPTRERLRFRSRSAAGTNIPFRLCALRSAAPLSSLEPATSGRSKVAGAKRRPTSASVCYLGHSTVYCVDTPLSSHDSAGDGASEHLQQHAGAGSDFNSVLDRERRKRRCNQHQTLALLAKRGLFQNLPVPQIFARLRRESLKNLTRRLQAAQYEKMAMDEYMRSCGMQLVAHSASSSPSSASSTPNGASVTSDASVSSSSAGATASLEAQDARSVVTPPMLAAAAVSTSSTTSNSSSLLAMRRMLVVTRQQFHIALEAFSLAPMDVNLLFSALDVGVEDRVALWEILCAVETLQSGHAELRRARVQVKARDLPKDLEALRQSFRIPNVQHAPLELVSASAGANTDGDDPNGGAA